MSADWPNAIYIFSSQFQYYFHFSLSLELLVLRSHCPWGNEMDKQAATLSIAPAGFTRGLLFCGILFPHSIAPRAARYCTDLGLTLPELTDFLLSLLLGCLENVGGCMLRGEPGSESLPSLLLFPPS